MISIEEAQKFLESHVKDEYQLLHAKMVATVMGAYAEKLEEQVDLWYLAGLLHDVDYDEYPEEHPLKSVEWFQEMDVPETLIHAVKAHAYDRTGIDPKTKLASALIAVDELSGFLYAYSLMRPTGFDGMKASKAVKKLKEPAFAAKISRDDIEYGVEKFDVDLSEHITFLINVFSLMSELSK